MYRIFNALMGIAASAVFVIPILCVYGKWVLHNRKRTLLYMAFAFYLVAVFTLVGLPSITYWRWGFVVQAIPFVGMISDLRNACLNVLLFVPLGVFLPVLWGKYRKAGKTLLFGLCMTGFIEFMQLFTFRTADINDIITNTVGTLLGYGAAWWATKGFTRYALPDARDRDAYILFGIVVIVMFFMQPFLSAWLWETIA